MVKDEARPETPKAGTSDPSDLYRTLFMRSADAILLIEGDSFIDCNHAAVAMLRCKDRSGVLETHPWEVSPPAQPDGRDSQEKAREMMAIANERGSHRFEWEHMRSDGTVLPVEVLLTAVERGSQKLLHVVWRDITERKHLEAQLRHAQKMEAIGKLAGGIAHDFNNLLMAVLGNCDLLELHLGQHSSLLSHVTQIRAAGIRAADLTRGLLAFSRKQVMRSEVLDLNSVVFELNLMLRRLIGDDVDLVCVVSGEDVRIRADRGQLEQVIINLVTNARDAMSRGGRLRIETRLVNLTEDTIGLGEDLKVGPYALLAVSDTGEGMDDAVVRHAFDPFFTTKPVGKGTGLGLSTVYGIVKQSGAGITIYSVPRRGTTVKVYWPITAESTDTVQRHTEPPARGGNETILVAEDEPMVSSVIATVLQRAGYIVHVVQDGEAAADAFQSLGTQVDLLITDVVMPKMGGPELVAKLVDLGFCPKVLYASGYATAALTDANVLAADIDILEKPFSAQALLRCVRSILDR